MSKVSVSVLLFCILFSLSGSASAESEKLKAFVSILPQAYFVERIGGSYVEVEVLVGPGQSPATYEPTPKQMARLGRARVYFRIGTPFEKGFIDKIANTLKGLEVVDTRKGVPLRFFHHGHGDEAQVPDPHIWLDPKRVKVQAETICETLSRLEPEHKAAFLENLRVFQGDLERLDKRIADILAPLRGQTFYVFHPAFGYFGDSYGIRQVAVEIEGKEPGAKHLVELITRAKEEGVRVIFVQPQFARKQAEKIAKAIGGVVVPMNPLPRDYVKSLEDMAVILRKGLLGP
ncbi:MAG: zinc ABC transporter substrate-binding protein [Deltaproteobacteria bacterium]|nr:zinc ABC transporter substrate-binding protein [Deltaproteobacteria bacterium]